MNISRILKTILSLIFLFTSSNAHAGINWSRYDDGPELFFGWEISFYFAIGAVVLFGLSWLLSDSYNKNGKIDSDIGCFLTIINIAFIICAICSAYIILPLAIIYTIIKAIISKK